MIKELIAAIAAFLSSGSADSVGMTEVPTWNGELKIDYDWDETWAGKRAIRKAKSLTQSDMAYGRLKLGNLAFVETTRTTRALDAEGKYNFVGVILDQGAAVIMPNDDLLAQVAFALRATPDAVSESTRFRTILILATGSDHYLNSKDCLPGVEVNSPTWVESNGMLTIEYYKTKSNGSMAPTPVKCVLKLDKNNKKEVQCIDVNIE